MIFEIENKIYKARELKDFSPTEYLVFSNLIKTIKDPIILNKEIFVLFTNIPEKTIKAIIWDEFPIIDWQSILSLTDLELKEKYLGISLPDLNELRLDKYISIDSVLTTNNPTIMDKEITVTTLTLLPNEYTQEEFNAFKERVSNELSIGNILSIFNYIIQWREDLIPNYPNLFGIKRDVNEGWDDGHEWTEEDEDEEEESDSGGGWGDTIDMLANDNLLKIDEVLEQPLIKTLNYLERKIIRNKKEIERIKNSR